MSRPLIIFDSTSHLRALFAKQRAQCAHPTSHQTLRLDIPLSSVAASTPTEALITTSRKNSCSLSSTKVDDGLIRPGPGPSAPSPSQNRSVTAPHQNRRPDRARIVHIRRRHGAGTWGTGGRRRRRRFPGTSTFAKTYMHLHSCRTSSRMRISSIEKLKTQHGRRALEGFER